MQRQKLVKLALLSLLMGVALTFLLYRAALHSRTQNQSTPPTPPSQIVVSSGPIRRGTRLEPSHLKRVPWSDKAQPGGAISQVEAAVGRVLKTDVVAIEPILESKLLAPGGRPGLPFMIQPGYRAVGIKVNEVTSVAGHATPGSRVDVLMTATPRDARDSVTQTILKDVLVLTAGASLEETRDGKPVTVNEITLQVTPEEAEKLSLAAIDAKINLSIRHHTDHEMPSTPGVRMTQLVDDPARRPVPAVRHAPRKAAAPTPRGCSVDLIMGSKRTTQTFSRKDGRITP